MPGVAAASSGFFNFGPFHSMIAGIKKAGKITNMEDNFWRDCPVVEIVPGKVHGRPAVKGSRVPADTMTEAADLDMMPEEIASDYRLSLDDVKQVLAYYSSHTKPALVP